MKTIQTLAITTFAVLLLQLPAHAALYEFTNVAVEDSFGTYNTGVFSSVAGLPNTKWSSAGLGWEIGIDPDGAGGMTTRTLRANSNNPGAVSDAITVSSLGPTAHSVMIKFKFRDIENATKGTTSIRVISPDASGNLWFDMAFTGSSKEITCGTSAEYKYVYTSGVTYDIAVVATQQAGGLSYIGPDGSEKTVPFDSYDLWVNNARVVAASTRSNTHNVSPALSSVALRIAKDNVPTHAFDDFQVLLPVIKEKGTVVSIR